MEKQLTELKAKIHDQSELIKRYNMRLKRSTESKEKLMSIVKELQGRNLIRENAEDILQVKIASIAFVIEDLKDKLK